MHGRGSTIGAALYTHRPLPVHRAAGGLLRGFSPLKFGDLLIFSVPEGSFALLIL